MSTQFELCFTLTQTHTDSKAFSEFYSVTDQADKAVMSTKNLTTEKKSKLSHTDFKMKINRYILEKRQQRWNNNENNKLLEIKLTLAEWKQSFKKPKRGGYIVLTLEKSYKDKTLLFTRRKTTTNLLCISDQIHRETHSHWMYWPSPYKKKLLHKQYEGTVPKYWNK